MQKKYLFGGLGAVAGILGIAKGVKTVNKTSEVQKSFNESKVLYVNKKEELEKRRINTKLLLNELGKLKLNIWSKQLKHFFNYIDNFKNLNIGKETIVNKNELHNIREISIRAEEVTSNGVNTVEDDALALFAVLGASKIFEYSSTGDAVNTLHKVSAATTIITKLGYIEIIEDNTYSDGKKDELQSEEKQEKNLLNNNILEFIKKNINLKETINQHSEIQMEIDEINNAITKLSKIDQLINKYEEILNEQSVKLDKLLNELKEEIINTDSSKKKTFGSRVTSFFKGIIYQDPQIDYENLSGTQKSKLLEYFVTASVVNSILDIPLLDDKGDINIEAENFLK